MKVIGITGGVGPEKCSTCLDGTGVWSVYLSDGRSCKSSFRKRNRMFQKIVDEFGDAVVGEDGELDRKEL